MKLSYVLIMCLPSLEKRCPTTADMSPQMTRFGDIGIGHHWTFLIDGFESCVHKTNQTEKYWYTYWNHIGHLTSLKGNLEDLVVHFHKVWRTQKKDMFKKE